MKSIIIGTAVVVVLSGGFFLFHMQMSSPKTTAANAPRTSVSTRAQTAKNTSDTNVSPVSPANSTSSSDTSSSGSTSTATTKSPTATPAKSTPATTTVPSPLNVTITANDDSASPETINVTKGQTVHLTFAVSTNGTYHGGLDFKNSDVGLDSGSIPEGSSKTMTFTATQSFKFTPYWYESNVQKSYFVTVNVT